MTLQYAQPHLSIIGFEPVDLPDLVVLTGVNGSGKSHLLEAIEAGKANIVGIPKNRIVKFNYETFKLENEGESSAHQIAAERETAWNHFKQKILPPLRQSRTQLGAAFDTLKTRSMSEDIPFLSIPDPNIVKYKSVFETQVHAQATSHPVVTGIFSISQNLRYPIDEIDQSEFNALYRPYTLKNDFLPSQLGKVFWDYYVKYRGNQVNEFQNEKYGKSYKVVSEENFIHLHGRKPWDMVNEVLEAFDTLNYRVNSPEGEDYFGKFQLKLIPASGSQSQIQFSHLSSGEKVLMALVAAVYKSSSDRKFPALLLLDEVDASLHPAMMKNMLSVIESIFLKQDVKVILVTHSPTTVALAPEESIFVMNKSGRQRIEKKSKQDALSVLTQGFVTLDQGLRILGETSGTHVTLITEGHNSTILSKALELFEIKDVIILPGLEAFTGKNQLRTLFDFFSKVQHQGKVMFVWDCDVSHNLKAENQCYPFILPKNTSNSLTQKGIENMFPDSAFTDAFIKTIALPGKSPVREFYEAKKTEFSRHIVATGTREDFSGFATLMEEISRIKQTATVMA